jgi:hypothetical protein
VLRHADYGSTTYWGGVVAGLFGLLLAGMTVREIKRVRNSVRKTTAKGRVVSAGPNKVTYYGDVVGKIIDVVFTTANGTRITFTEGVDERYAVQQEVIVHYDPMHPRDTATVFAPRAAFVRAFGYAAASIALISLFVSSQFFGWN